MPVVGSENKLRKLTLAEVKEIRKLHAKGYVPYAILAKRFKVSFDTIADVVHARTWIRVK